MVHLRALRCLRGGRRKVIIIFAGESKLCVRIPTHKIDGDIIGQIGAKFRRICPIVIAVVDSFFAWRK